MKKLLSTVALSLTVLSVPTTMLAASPATNNNDPNSFLNPDGSKMHVQYPMSDKDKEILKEKLKLAQEYADVHHGKLSKDIFDKDQAAFEAKVGVKKRGQVGTEKAGVASPFLVSGYNTSNYSNYITSLIQQSQITYYYCGPATVSEMVNGNGGSVTQDGAANYMGTTTNGTDWADSSGYPVQNALNYYLSTSWYEPYGTSVDANTLETNITYDIDHGFPIAGDAYEVAGGPHLVGHPDQNIFHWFAIDGYKNYGSYTHYADSVSGASSISWSSNVPQYSFLDTSTIATIIDGRGAIL